MEHPHQQQLKVLAIAVGTLTAVLQIKGTLAQSEVEQVFSIAEQLTPESEESGHKMIAVLRKAVAVIEGQVNDTLLSVD